MYLANLHSEYQFHNVHENIVNEILFQHLRLIYFFIYSDKIVRIVYSLFYIVIGYNMKIIINIVVG